MLQIGASIIQLLILPRCDITGQGGDGLLYARALLHERAVNELFFVANLTIFLRVVLFRNGMHARTLAHTAERSAVGEDNLRTGASALSRLDPQVGAVRVA